MTRRILERRRNPPRFLWALVIVAMTAGQHRCSEALSSNPNSPWRSASWRLVLDIGREPSSDLPEEWGRSGARLSFPVQVRVESEALPEADRRDPLWGGAAANRLRVVHPELITYVTEGGERTVPLQEMGGWTLRLGRQRGHASLLRFWLDVGTSSDSQEDPGVAARKKDVTLRTNERLYFAALCWRESDWRLGRTLMQPLVDAYEKAQARLVDRVSHVGGDRRLDGVDALDTLAAYKDMAGLTLDRDDKRRQLLDAQEYLPPPRDLPLGNWPGSTELLALQPMELFVRRRQGLIPKDDYHFLGTWTAKPLNVIPEEIENKISVEKQIVDDEEEYSDDEEDGQEEDEDEDEHADDMEGKDEADKMQQF